jgi:hypothetical protein
VTALPELARSEHRLVVDASFGADGITVRLVGEAGMEAMSAMEKTLAGLHGEMQARKAPAAVIDLTKLEFMNSSCFKAFVTWIDRVQELDPAAHYRIRFVSNPTILWQRRSLQALQCFAAELISIDT